MPQAGFQRDPIVGSDQDSTSVRPYLLRKWYRYFRGISYFLYLVGLDVHLLQILAYFKS